MRWIEELFSKNKKKQEKGEKTMNDPYGYPGYSESEVGDEIRGILDDFDGYCANMRRELEGTFRDLDNDLKRANKQLKKKNEAVQAEAVLKIILPILSELKNDVLDMDDIESIRRSVTMRYQYMKDLLSRIGVDLHYHERGDHISSTDIVQGGLVRTGDRSLDHTCCRSVSMGWSIRGEERTPAIEKIQIYEFDSALAKKTSNWGGNDLRGKHDPSMGGRGNEDYGDSSSGRETRGSDDDHGMPTNGRCDRDGKRPPREQEVGDYPGGFNAEKNGLPNVSSNNADLAQGEMTPQGEKAQNYPNDDHSRKTIRVFFPYDIVVKGPHIGEINLARPDTAVAIPCTYTLDGELDGGTFMYGDEEHKVEGHGKTIVATYDEVDNKVIVSFYLVDGEKKCRERLFYKEYSKS